MSYPQLPDPERPSLGEWLRILERELADLDGGERVVVCHSLGCLLWLHHAAGTDGAVDRLLLVAPPEDPQVPEPAAEFRLGGMGGTGLGSSVRTVPRVVRGTKDLYSPSGVPRWAIEAGCEIDEIEGAEHLNPDDGHGPWAAPGRWCVDPAARIGG